MKNKKKRGRPGNEANTSPPSYNSTECTIMYNLWWLCIFFAAAALTQHFWLEAKYTMWTCTSQGGDVEESKANPLSDIFCCKNESSELGKSYLIYNWRFQPVNSYFQNHFPFFLFCRWFPLWGAVATHWLKHLVCILGQGKAWMFSGTVCGCTHTCMVENSFNTEWVVHTKEWDNVGLYLWCSYYVVIMPHPPRLVGGGV